MRLYVYIFLGLLGVFAGAFVMFILDAAPGMVLISIRDYTVEMSVWYAATLIVLLFVSIILMWKALFWTKNTLAHSFSWIQESREKRLERRTQSGFAHFVEGDWLAAKKELLGVAKDSPKPELHFLAAAKSAMELGNQEESQFLLEQAEKHSEAGSVGLIKAKARMQLVSNEARESLKTLDLLPSAQQNNPVVLAIKQEALKRLGDWKALAKLLPKIKSYCGYAADEFIQLEENVYLSLLSSEVKREKVSTESLTQTWSAFPKGIKKNSSLVGLYCTFLHQLEEDEVAASLLVKALKNSWHKGLVELFGKLNPSDSQLQLQQAESWLKAHPNDPHLLFALGRLAVKNSLWGKAKDYLEQSLALLERPEAYAELGALMRRLGEKERSAIYFEKGLLLKNSGTA
ncbi:MAG: hypothetical protein K6L76_12065 [Agarilytica sp.]